MRILVAESSGMSPDVAGTLSAHELRREELRTRDDLLGAVATAEVLWVRLRHRIDREVMDAASSLTAIVTATTGLNHIDLEEAARRGIAVLSLKGESGFLRSIRATAEHTIGLMLALIRNLPAAARDVERGRWDRDRFRGGELYGSTIGIVGMGRLGTLVAGYLRAFGAEVVFCDPNVSAESQANGPRKVGLRELMAAARIVSVHVNLEESTRGLIGRLELDAMRPDAYLVNTSRGELVDEAALLDALTSGRIAGAALDVLAAEGTGELSDSPLVHYAREHSNLVITPHIGGCTVESMHRTEAFMAQKLEKWLASRG